MDGFNKLIVLLMAIEGKAKDIHYTCSGANFYGNHLFADRVADGMDDFIDQIKETCLLGKNVRPLSSRQYFVQASQIIDEEKTFRSLYKLILDCLILIEKIENVSRGDNKVLDDIAGKLQNDKGLLQIMLGEF